MPTCRSEGSPIIRVRVSFRQLLAYLPQSHLPRCCFVYSFLFSVVVFFFALWQFTLCWWKIHILIHISYVLQPAIYSNEVLGTKIFTRHCLSEGLQFVIDIWKFATLLQIMTYILLFIGSYIYCIFALKPKSTCWTALFM